MKKLMIAAAIVCAAVASQASTFLWTTSKIYLGLGSDGKAIDITTLKDGQKITPPTSGTKGYADSYGSITWTAEMILSMAGVEDEKLTPTVTWQTHKINTANVQSEIFSLPTIPDVGKTYSWEVVITGTWKDADNKEWSVVSDPIKNSAEYFNTSTEEIAIAAPGGWTVHGPGADPVPEPTSGLLLLLGVAGLSLKRKRA